MACKGGAFRGPGQSSITHQIGEGRRCCPAAAQRPPALGMWPSLVGVQDHRCRAGPAGRGVDGLWGMYSWLDRAPLGRNETGMWWRRHDEYDGGSGSGQGTAREDNWHRPPTSVACELAQAHDQHLPTPDQALVEQTRRTGVSKRSRLTEARGCAILAGAVCWTQATVRGGATRARLRSDVKPRTRRDLARR
jgi:Bacterial protein of unknown function (DUF899)